MVTTSTLMENLQQEGVSPDLLLAVNEYRTTHPLTEALAPRCLLYTSPSPRDTR